MILMFFAGYLVGFFVFVDGLGWCGVVVEVMVFWWDSFKLLKMGNLLFISYCGFTCGVWFWAFLLYIMFVFLGFGGSLRALCGLLVCGFFNLWVFGFRN